MTYRKRTRSAARRIAKSFRYWMRKVSIPFDTGGIVEHNPHKVTGALLRRHEPIPIKLAQEALLN